MVHLGVAPETWIDSIGRVRILQEGVCFLAPHHLAAVVFDLQFFRGGDEVLLGKFQFLLIIEIQQGIDFFVCFLCDVSGFFCAVRRFLSIL